MEIEAKFAVLNPDRFHELQSATEIGEFALSTGRMREVYDTYLDTSDRRILAAGYACRLRQQDEMVIAALKSLESAEGAIHRREELELVLPEVLPPDRWPDSPLTNHVQRLAGQAPLDPLFSLSQLRRVRPVFAGERQIAEMSLDDVRASFGEREESYLEVEVELRPEGTEDDLRAIVVQLEALEGLVPERLSKFERGLLLVDAGEGWAGGIPPIEPDDTMATAARKVLRRHYEQMIANEVRARAGDVEGVHDMRVAVRRIRNALQVFEGYLEAAALVPHKKGLRRLGRVLGAVRDLDVFWEKTSAYQETFAEVERPSLTLLKQAWEEACARARRELVAYLNSEEYANFKAVFERYLSRPPEALAAPVARFQPHHVADVVPVAIYERFAAVRAYERWLDEDALPEDYRCLRIAARGLRYTLEYFREILGTGAKPAIERVKKLQDHLGDLQDAVVAIERLDHVLAWGSWIPPQDPEEQTPLPFVAPDVAAYRETRRDEAVRLIAIFPRLWRRFRSPAFKQWIADAVTPL